MPLIRINGLEIFYEETGTGSETIVFSHGLMMNHHMFDHQVNYFKDRYRCISYDHRGQGKSETPRRYYDMEAVYEDGVALIEALNAKPCHFVGLSMGGFVGMRLGSRRPDLVKSLVLMETSADPEPTENLPRYRLMQTVAKWLSLRLIVNGASKSLLGKTFLTDPARKAERKLWQRHMAEHSRMGLVMAAESVFTRLPVYDEIARIKMPTLVMVGDEDIATKPEKAQRIHRQIKGSKLVTIPCAGHSASIEQPDFVNQAIDEFLQSL